MKTLFVVFALIFANKVYAQDIELSSFQTTFLYEKDNVNRADNIKVASRHIDGVILGPGEIFSYNETVGPRTEKRGFKEAKILLKGRYVPGVGGGVCQVSTTLYNAALLAGLEIVEVHHHSIASSYVDPSRDATVEFGSFNLKFKNNYEFPITIFMDTSTPGILKASIFGAKKFVNVTVEVKIVEKHKHHRVFIENPEMKKGRSKLIQSGSDGYIVIRKIITTDAVSGEKINKKTNRFVYKQSNRIVMIGTKLEKEVKNE